LHNFTPSKNKNLLLLQQIFFCSLFFFENVEDLSKERKNAVTFLTQKALF